MKTNILYLNINSNLGGAERCLLEEVTNLDKNRFNPIVGLFSKGPLIHELKKEKINYRVFPSSKRFLRQSKEEVNAFFINSPLILLNIIKIVKSIANFVQKKQISLIVSNSFKIHILSLFLRRYAVSVKIAWRYQDSLPRNKFLRKVLLFAAKRVPIKIIALSDFIKNQFIRERITKQKLVTIYPTFSSKECSAREEKQYKKELSITKKDFAVGCLGALVPWKGQEYLIKSANLLKDKIPNLKVFIVGDEIYDTKAKTSKKYLMNLTKELGLEDTIIFTGFLKEPEKILNALDLVVHTSIKPEPFGRVIVEAMLCEKPVIASASGGPLEIIKNNQTGVLIQPGNHKVLAKTILSLYKNPKKMEILGANAKDSAIQNFNAQQQIKNIEGEYTRLLQ